MKFFKKRMPNFSTDKESAVKLYIQSVKQEFMLQEGGTINLRSKTNVDVKRRRRLQICAEVLGIDDRMHNKILFNQISKKSEILSVIHPALKDIEKYEREKKFRDDEIKRQKFKEEQQREREENEDFITYMKRKNFWVNELDEEEILKIMFMKPYWNHACLDVSQMGPNLIDPLVTFRGIHFFAAMNLPLKDRQKKWDDADLGIEILQSIRNYRKQGKIIVDDIDLDWFVETGMRLNNYQPREYDNITKIVGERLDEIKLKERLKIEEIERQKKLEFEMKQKRLKDLEDERIRLIRLQEERELKKKIDLEALLNKEREEIIRIQQEKEQREQKRKKDLEDALIRDQEEIKLIREGRQADVSGMENKGEEIEEIKVPELTLDSIMIHQFQTPIPGRMVCSHCTDDYHRKWIEEMNQEVRAAFEKNHRKGAEGFVNAVEQIWRKHNKDGDFGNPCVSGYEHDFENPCQTWACKFVLDRYTIDKYWINDLKDKARRLYLLKLAG